MRDIASARRESLDPERDDCLSMNFWEGTTWHCIPKQEVELSVSWSYDEHNKNWGSWTKGVPDLIFTERKQYWKSLIKSKSNEIFLINQQDSLCTKQHRSYSKNRRSQNQESTNSNVNFQKMEQLHTSNRRTTSFTNSDTHTGWTNDDTRSFKGRNSCTWGAKRIPSILKIDHKIWWN